MKKFGMIIAMLAVCLLLAGCRLRDRQAAPTPTTVPPTAVPEPPTEAAEQPAQSPQSDLILFSDDFQDGQLDGWQSNGDWMIYQNGDVYTLGTQGAGSAWVPGGNTWTDYALRSFVRQESGVLSINYRLSPEGRYFVNLRANGIFLAKEQPPGTITTLVQNDPLTANIWHYIVIAGEGGIIQVYVDRQLVLSYTDPAPLTGGTIGFGALADSRGDVDNLIANLLNTHLVQGSAGWAPAADQPSMEYAGPALVDVPAADAEPAPLPAAPQPDAPQPAPGDPVQVVFTVEGTNAATIDAGQCITVEWFVENAPEIYYQGGAVLAHEARDECPDVTTTYVLETVSWSQQINEYTVTVTVSDVAAGPGPEPVGGGVDVQLIGVSIETGEARAVGHALAVGVNVRNNGSGTAGAFTVQWYPMNDGIVGCAWDIGTLGPGEVSNLSCVYPGYPIAGNFEWGAVVDVEHETGDTNRNNNRGSGNITIRPADVEVEPPLAPVNCRVVTAARNFIYIEWDVQGQAEQEGFRVYQAVSSLETVVGEIERGASVENLEPNTQYHFDVRAYRENQESAPNTCAVDATTAP